MLPLAVGVGTVLLAVLRILILPTTQFGFGGRFGISYVVVVAAVGVILGLLVLGWRRRGTAYAAMTGRRLFVAAIGAVGVGGFLAVREAFDIWTWFAKGELPPPTVHLSGAVAGGMLVCEMVFGLLAAGILIYMGLTWLSKGVMMAEKFRLAALAPVLWMWMRLGRYMLSYTSAVEIRQSFYNFAMFLFELLFLYAFARYVAGVGKSPRFLPVYAAVCGTMAMSGAIAAAVLGVLGEADAYKVTQLAGVSDFVLGLFAWAVLVALKKADPSDDPSEGDVAADSEVGDASSDDAGLKEGAVREAFVAEADVNSDEDAGAEVEEDTVVSEEKD